MATESFDLFLKRQDLAENTIASYLWTIKHFLANYGEVNRENLLAYKGFLLEHFKPQTVNLRLQGINKYLEFIRKEKLKMKFVKVQQKNYLENVISDADYRFLKRRLKSDGHLEWFFVIWFMGATGARISELLKIKAEHVEFGYMDLYSKGGKIRRLYIPKMLREEAGAWLRETGYLVRLYLQESIRRCHFTPGDFPTVEEICLTVWIRPESSLSSFFPPSFCEKLFE